MKRIITLMFAAMLVGQAWAEDFTIGNLKYTVTNETNHYVSVGKAETEPTGALNIPEKVTNPDNSAEYTVTSIGSFAFRYCSGLTSVTIPNSVTSIGDYAFEDCSGLTSVTIPNSVTSMDKAVFKGCSSLESITLPYAFKQPFGYIFGEFEYEDAIKTVQEQLIEKTINKVAYMEYEFYIPSTLKSVTINGGNIANSAFHNCKGISTIIIGYSVAAISEEAFYGCSSLTSVTIPNTVTCIGVSVFKGCISLTSISIPESVTSIGTEAFYGCSGLTSLVIGESVENVGEDAFYRCDSLSSVIIKSDINIPYNSNLWIKKDGVQYNVKNKNTVSVDSDIWDDYDYSGDIIIPETVIAGDTFNIKSIGSYAFSYDSITSITIPNSVTEIGEAAFSHCRCLTSITIPNSVVSIGGWVFPNCSSLTEINVESGNTEYVSVDGVLFNKDKTILISFPAGKTGEYTIPNTVKEIATHAFSGCNDSTTVIIPKTVRTIDYYAFYDCAATINCMVNEKPDDWDTRWRGYDNFKGDVIWGYKPTPVTETAANAVNIYAHGNTIVVENATDEISVYDAMGRLVCRDVARHVSTVAESGIRTEIRINKPGVYIAKTGAAVKRIVMN